ncbi:MAG: zinc-ribbon domain-containing protein [Thermodesulfobacteriota bacterium]
MSVREIKCTSCEAVYRIDASKIPDKLVRTKCKKCGSVIVINEHLAPPVKPEGEREPQEVPPAADVKPPPVEEKAAGAAEPAGGDEPEITTSEEGRLAGIVRKVKESLQGSLQSSSKNESSEPTGEDEVERLPEILRELRESIRSHFEDESFEVTGERLYAYILIKVMLLWVVTMAFVLLVGFVVPFPLNLLLGINLFVVAFNWRIVVDIIFPEYRSGSLVKDSLLKLILPLLLINGVGLLFII